MTVGELLSRTDSRELTGWAAYERVTGPLDPRERGDVQAAIIAATVSNAMRSKKGRSAKPADFIPDWDKTSSTQDSGPQTPDDHLRAVRQINAAMGGGRA